MPLALHTCKHHSFIVDPVKHCQHYEQHDEQHYEQQYTPILLFHRHMWTMFCQKMGQKTKGVIPCRLRISQGAQVQILKLSNLQNLPVKQSWSLQFQVLQRPQTSPLNLIQCCI